MIVENRVENVKKYRYNAKSNRFREVSKSFVYVNSWQNVLFNEVYYLVFTRLRVAFLRAIRYNKSVTKKRSSFV